MPWDSYPRLDADKKMSQRSLGRTSQKHKGALGIVPTSPRKATKYPAKICGVAMRGNSSGFQSTHNAMVTSNGRILTAFCERAAESDAAKRGLIIERQILEIITQEEGDDDGDSH